MCGRYAFGDYDTISQRVENANLALDEVRRGRQATIQFNISPGRYGPVYRADTTTDSSNGNNDNENDDNSNDKSYRVVEFMKWGLIPSFAKEPKIGSTFNCRAESLQTNQGLWTGVKQYKRCIVLAEGYFEWHNKKNAGAKLAHFIKRKDGQLLCMAGLWDVNKKIEKDESLYSYTVITTPAHEKIEWLHHRMPLILEPEQVADWLRPGDKWSEYEDEFVSMLKPYDASKLDVYRVGNEVGKLNNDSKDLIKPLKDKKNTIDSFFGKKRKPENEGESTKEKSKISKIT